MIEVRTYMAGKIGKMDWRHEVMGHLGADLRAHTIGWKEREWIRGVDLRTIPICTPDVTCIVYTGPFFFGCDHGCSHGKNTHGVGDSACSGAGFDDEDPLCSDRILPGKAGHKDCVVKSRPPMSTVAHRNRLAIERSDLFFAWIEASSPIDYYGTILEIGYAAANPNRSVVIASDGNLSDDLWFVERFATTKISGLPVLEAFKEAVRRHQDRAMGMAIRSKA